MPRPPLKRRVGPRLAALFVAGAGLAALAGCDVVENADIERGRALFLRGSEPACGSCHQLAEAGTGAGVAPSLDSAFADARASGQDSDTFEGVIEAQIENPRPASPDQVDVYMPTGDDLGLSDDDIRDIAAYVASVAGVPDIGPPELPPDEFFSDTCGSCHALQEAGAAGTTGPSLDDVLPGQSAAQVRRSIIDPGADLTSGFDDGIMPTDYAETIPEKDLAALIDFLLESAGK